MAYFNKKKTVRVPFSLSSLIGGTPSIGVPSNLPGVDFLVPMRYSSHEDLGVKRASPGPKTNRSVALEKSPHLKNKHSEPNVEDLGSKFVPLGLETNPTVTLEASPLQSLQSLQQFKSGEQEPDKTAIKNAKLHSQKIDKFELGKLNATYKKGPRTKSRKYLRLENKSSRLQLRMPCNRLKRLN